MKIFKSAVLAIALALMSISTQASTVYSLVDQFDSVDNITGPWLLGHYDPNTLDSNTFNTYTGFETGVEGSLDIWRDGTTSDPNWVKNQGATFTLHDILFREGMVTAGPHDGGTVARLNIYESGTYFVDAWFGTVQSNSNPFPTAYICTGTASCEMVGLGVVPNLASGGVGYEKTLTLTAGSYIDFLVGFGSNTTEVTAVVTKLPEPGTLWMLLLGFSVIASIRWSIPK
jgi:hypothetical protein